ncbi:hypothetical protein CLAFUW4_08156 [Fulvia fulva]|uniref:G domain-containing protein n=1 Tax=Passalora fulva TaxID=5499 RepID=A0A9Q8LCK4_PASFU|nr:uncharacterized protein CLAFUR5_08270 [Fulvia fulva]KAK4629188.1 hypothetical protein CLAFUR4_08161 [Fulvia fulva]KAK4630241.1 hypothetical protein CLAFUR0_08156 [Fulvia fulva]UJO14962.1 hypothetical protein CLAFUR5_08270 [Fulvia fulva]WPV12637.1 hypothetical protein CLAFUW4_08156 [Fulvia fulva]WPV27386.1 hypothetical protein CLAFUW7_08156 [Fulvia fulva]
MLLEAYNYGVSVDFDGPTEHLGTVEKPLSAVFPLPRKNNAELSTSTFQAANGVVVTMQDLKDVHVQPKYNGQYGVKLGSRYGSIRAKKARTPFDINGYLRGYCDHAPQGTIIHPSVYLLLDEHITVALDTKEAKLQRSLEDWRDKTLGMENGMTNFGFWGGDDLASAPDPGAIRVLVCGNTGVGKSTLINKTFGVDVTQSSDRSRGIHDVKEEITFEGRPDLVVHDSGGFEAGADAEFLAIEEFLKAKSAVLEVEQRLHVIWFCIEINSARTLQTATEKLFQAVGVYANEVPIVVVATKKDGLLDLEYMKRKKELKKLKQPFNEEACEQYAEEQLQVRLDQIREEMESVPGGRLDALVAVSQGKYTLLECWAES